jgi:hypothetical protein
VPPPEQARAGVPGDPKGSKARAPGSAGAPGRHGTASRAGGPGPPLAGEPPRRRPRRRETTTTASGCQARGRSRDRGGWRAARGGGRRRDSDPSVCCSARRHRRPSSSGAPTYLCAPLTEKIAPSQVCLTMGRRGARRTRPRRGAGDRADELATRRRNRGSQRFLRMRAEQAVAVERWRWLGNWGMELERERNGKHVVREVLLLWKLCATSAHDGPHPVKREVGPTTPPAGYLASCGPLTERYGYKNSCTHTSTFGRDVYTP